MKVKLHEALKNLIKESAGYANDERYSHAPEKLKLKKLDTFLTFTKSKHF